MTLDTLRVYSTLRRTVEPFVPLVPGQVGIYLCGMTVYDDAHIGHARSAVVFDTIVRYLRHRGWGVRYVRNFTDVDDKIIRHAAQTGEAPLDLARRYIASYRQDMAALGLLQPDVEPLVSEHIDDIIDLIARLVARGHAYAAEGSVWFSVESDPRYGHLSGQQPAQLRSQSSGDPEGGKRQAADFALWKAARPGEPSWESPWGAGRPGWHIECSAMSMRHLGETFDIHGGGLDLLFPHHENEIAQSEGATGQTYARHWLHHGLLTIKGGKMGHSLGNFIRIHDLLAAWPAEALRLYYLQAHYRSPLPYDAHALDRALAMLARLYDALAAASTTEGVGEGDAGAEVLALAEALPGRITEAMDSDFNTAAALAAAFTLARAVNRLVDHKKALRRAGPALRAARSALETFAAALGLLQQSPEAFWAEVRAKRLPAMGLSEAQVEARVAARSAARQARDWAQADAIRAALRADGIEVRDTPDGGSAWWVLLDSESESESESEG